MSPFAVGKGLFATINSFEPHNSLSGPRAGLYLLGEQRLSSGLQMRASEVSDMVKGEEAPRPSPSSLSDLALRPQASPSKFLTLLSQQLLSLRASPGLLSSLCLFPSAAPPPVKPIYIRCLPSSPSVSPPTHRFVVSSGPLNSTSSKVCPPKRCVPASPRLGARASPGPVARLGLLPGLLLPTPLPILAAPTSHLPPLKTRRQEPRRPRIVNAWTEEVEELPWSSTSSGGSPGVSRLPRAVMLPGLGRSHHLESSVVQDLEPATPAPSSSIIGKLGWKWPSWGALRRAKEKTQAVAPASEAVSELQ
ncbi:uncharacterized protein LOC102406900 isoform X2 [Bubalus bubalis]|uniref:uncharacterized protein LOC102406900 isoform X2 n=1 Tax=Bubalus bubalis TaxID=89462 RepID=UPI001D0F752C|nr:uncharacterized protein LOC102406900 isoform X2 [Bubalus bubalis]